jgi:hypothetical protein
LHFYIDGRLPDQRLPSAEPGYGVPFGPRLLKPETRNTPGAGYRYYPTLFEALALFRDTFPKDSRTDLDSTYRPIWCLGREYGLRGEMEKAQEKPQLSATDVGSGKGDQPAPNAEEDVWDEERIEQGLKIAKEMHIQVALDVDRY